MPEPNTQNDTQRAQSEGNSAPAVPVKPAEQPIVHAPRAEIPPEESIQTPKKRQQPHHISTPHTPIDQVTTAAGLHQHASPQFIQTAIHQQPMSPQQLQALQGGQMGQFPSAQVQFSAQQMQQFQLQRQQFQQHMLALQQQAQLNQQLTNATPPTNSTPVTPSPVKQGAPNTQQGGTPTATTTTTSTSPESPQMQPQTATTAQPYDPLKYHYPIQLHGGGRQYAATAYAATPMNLFYQAHFQQQQLLQQQQQEQAQRVQAATQVAQGVRQPNTTSPVVTSPERAGSGGGVHAHGQDLQRYPNLERALFPGYRNVQTDYRTTYSQYGEVGQQQRLQGPFSQQHVQHIRPNVVNVVRGPPRPKKPPPSNDIDMSTVTFPYRLTAVCEIVDLGELSLAKPFRSTKYIYPIGFHAKRNYPDWVDPSKKVDYDCIINEHDGEPIFTIKNPRDPTFLATGKTPTFAWREVNRKINQQRTNERPISNVAGHEYFGLGSSIVKSMMKGMDNWDKLEALLAQEIKTRKRRGNSTKEADVDVMDATLSSNADTPKAPKRPKKAIDPEVEEKKRLKREQQAEKDRERAAAQNIYTKEMFSDEGGLRKTTASDRRARMEARRREEKDRILGQGGDVTVLTELPDLDHISDLNNTKKKRKNEAAGGTKRRCWRDEDEEEEEEEEEPVKPKLASRPVSLPEEADVGIKPLTPNPSYCFRMLSRGLLRGELDDGVKALFEAVDIEAIAIVQAKKDRLAALRREDGEGDEEEEEETQENRDSEAKTAIINIEPKTEQENTNIVVCQPANVHNTDPCTDKHHPQYNSQHNSQQHPQHQHHPQSTEEDGTSGKPHVKEQENGSAKDNGNVIATQNCGDDDVGNSTTTTTTTATTTTTRTTTPTTTHQPEEQQQEQPVAVTIGNDDNTTTTTTTDVHSSSDSKQEPKQQPQPDLFFTCPLNWIKSITPKSDDECIQTLRESWEFASVLNLILNFLRAPLSLPKITSSDLEETLIQTEETCSEYHSWLLHQVISKIVVTNQNKGQYQYPDPHDDNTDGLFVDYTERVNFLVDMKLRVLCCSAKGHGAPERCRTTYGWRLPKYNPMEKYESFWNIPVKLKVLILLAFCEERLEHTDMRQTLDKAAMRVERVVYDRGISYFFFGEDVGRVFYEFQQVELDDDEDALSEMVQWSENPTPYRRRYRPPTRRTKHNVQLQREKHANSFKKTCFGTIAHDSKSLQVFLGILQRISAETDRIHNGGKRDQEEMKGEHHDDDGSCCNNNTQQHSTELQNNNLDEQLPSPGIWLEHEEAIEALQQFFKPKVDEIQYSEETKAKTKEKSLVFLKKFHKEYDDMIEEKAKQRQLVQQKKDAEKKQRQADREAAREATRALKAQQKKELELHKNDDRVIATRPRATSTRKKQARATIIDDDDGEDSTEEKEVGHIRGTLIDEDDDTQDEEEEDDSSSSSSSSDSSGEEDSDSSKSSETAP